MMMKDKKQRLEPDWAHRAKYIDHKPDWVGVDNHIVPLELWDLGQVFFPLPRARKAWSYPHHKQEHRYEPTDEIFNAYIEAGSGYGIVCADDLVIIDIDAVGFVEPIIEMIPDSLWQVTGSRTGVHIFLKCEGLNTRQTLYYSLLGNKTHIGEIKCDPHGYVVGPGSKHPSGNTYGPLKGDKIATIQKEKLLDILDEYIINTGADYIPTFNKSEPKIETKRVYKFYELDADDVVPWLEPDKRVKHPGHGSSTWDETGGRIGNFMKNKDRDTFICWRHNYGGGQGCGLNPRQLLAQIKTGKECDVVRHNWGDDLTLYWHAWKQAVDDGLVSYYEIPYKVAKGYAIENNWIEKDEELRGKLYWDAMNTIRISIQEEHLNFERIE